MSIAAILVGGFSGVLLHRFVVITGKVGRQQTQMTKSLLSNLLDGLHAIAKTDEAKAPQAYFSTGTHKKALRPRAIGLIYAPLRRTRTCPWPKVVYATTDASFLAIPAMPPGLKGV